LSRVCHARRRRSAWLSPILLGARPRPRCSYRQQTAGSPGSHYSADMSMSDRIAHRHAGRTSAQISVDMAVLPCLEHHRLVRAFWSGPGHHSLKINYGFCSATLANNPVSSI
jgi:hypothetical protein